MKTKPTFYDFASSRNSNKRYFKYLGVSFGISLLVVLANKYWIQSETIIWMVALMPALIAGLALAFKNWLDYRREYPE